MVYFVRICTKKNGRRIEFIQINGHGNDQGLRHGNVWMDLPTIEKYKTQLALVAPMLSKSCTVEIAACEAGKAVEVVRKFYSFLGGVTIVGYLLNTTGGVTPTAPPVIISPGGGPYTIPAPSSGGYSQPGTPPPSK